MNIVMYNHIRCSHIIGLSTVFLSMLMIFGLFLGYLKMLSFQSALFALLVSVGVSVIINKFFGGSKLKIKSPKTTYSLAAIFVLLIFAGLLLFIMFPEMVFPVSCSDLLNHARTTRTIAKDTIFSAIPSNIPPTGIPLTYIHSYPLGLYGISAIFYEFFGNAYVILSLFTLFLLLLIGIVVYTISFQVTRNEKIAFLSLFLSLFSITTLWIFESGFIPQILGSFFLLVCVYCFIEKNKTLFLFACIGLFAYPPLLTVLILFLLFESIPKKLSWNLLKSRFCGNSHYFAMILFSAIIIFPESIGLFIQYIGSAKYLTGALLVR
ncbi:MAG: hypothetical protein NTY48_04295, partial [Candidatus Diapherotrites archaeon]|nr:hypothetical protein [Candidatus Diapherotrites archaeon]